VGWSVDWSFVHLTGCLLHELMNVLYDRAHHGRQPLRLVVRPNKMHRTEEEKAGVSKEDISKGALICKNVC
jgi:hypothetical protein